MRWIWSDGQFSWTFVALLVFLTVTLVVFDLAWRMFVIRFGALALYATIFVAAGIIILTLASIVGRRARGRNLA
jgi:hypothetical protein